MRLTVKQLKMLEFLRSNAGKNVSVEEARVASGLLPSSWGVYWTGGRYAPFLEDDGAGGLHVVASENLSEKDFYDHVKQTKGASPGGKAKKTYRLDAKTLGVGGCAKVFRGVHRVSGAVVAVKVADPGIDNGQRMRREIEVMNELEDPNIMPIVDYADDYGWYSMPVAQALHEIRDVGVTSINELVLDVARGLKAGHDLGYVHRDVTPGNILLLPSPEKRWVVGDWGTVRRPTGQTTIQATVAGALFGTELFAAPELWTDAHNADLRCDIYSLGRVVAWLHYLRLIPNVPSIPIGDWSTFVTATTQLDRDSRPSDLVAALELAPGLSGLLE